MSPSGTDRNVPIKLLSKEAANGDDNDESEGNVTGGMDGEGEAERAFTLDGIEQDVAELPPGKRLKKRFEEQGASGLVHGLRGKPSNRKGDAGQRQRVLALFREKYHDIGATLAAEYLQEENKITVAVETLRSWLKESGLYQPQRKSRAHRSWRPRRERTGELVQMDGSPHAPLKLSNCSVPVFVWQTTG